MIQIRTLTAAFLMIGTRDERDLFIYSIINGGLFMQETYKAVIERPYCCCFARSSSRILVGMESSRQTPGIFPTHDSDDSVLSADCHAFNHL